MSRSLDKRFVAPLQGLAVGMLSIPRALPEADMLRPLQGKLTLSPLVFMCILLGIGITFTLDTKRLYKF